MLAPRTAERNSIIFIVTINNRYAGRAHLHRSYARRIARRGEVRIDT